MKLSCSKLFTIQINPPLTVKDPPDYSWLFISVHKILFIMFNNTKDSICCLFTFLYLSLYMFVSHNSCSLEIWNCYSHVKLCFMHVSKAHLHQIVVDCIMSFIFFHPFINLHSKYNSCQHHYSVHISYKFDTFSPSFCCNFHLF